MWYTCTLKHIFRSGRSGHRTVRPEFQLGVDRHPDTERIRHHTAGAILQMTGTLFPFCSEADTQHNVEVFPTYVHLVCESDTDADLILRGLQNFLGSTQYTVDITGFPTVTAEHGFHVHAGVPDGADCDAAGSHYNPNSVNHGGINSATRFLRFLKVSRSKTSWSWFCGNQLLKKLSSWFLSTLTLFT